MVVRNGRVYMVSRSDGETQVMDMAQLGSMAGNMSLCNDAFDSTLLHHKKLTVAGYRGEVYSVSWRDLEGTHTAEAVLSTHPDVVNFYRAIKLLSDSMARSMRMRISQDENHLGSFLQNKKAGLLRLDNEFRIASMNKRGFDPYFRPARPTHLDAIIQHRRLSATAE